MSSVYHAAFDAVDSEVVTYQDRSPRTSECAAAPISVGPCVVPPPPPSKHQRQVQPSSTASAPPAHTPAFVAHSTASLRALGQASRYSSTIRTPTKALGNEPHVATPSHRHLAWSRSAHSASESALGASPKPRTPTRYGGHNGGAAASAGSGSSWHGIHYADLDCSPAAAFTPPLTSHKTARVATAVAHQATADSSVPYSASVCWMCETWCESGPGSTWPEAPALFFPKATDGPSVSLLTLCSTCASAVGGDTQVTSQQVLQRCHHTPVIRYRTAAYINAVREYKLLLELMAGKVARSCERMESSQLSVTRQQHRRHAYGATEERQSYRNPSIDAAGMPLTSLPLPVQDSVLSQLLEALEDLLQRDGRAVRLAAAQTSLSQESSPPRFSGVMAPRERRVLLEELVHVERQLMSVRSSAAAAAIMSATPGALPQPLQGRHLYDVPSASLTRTHGRADAGDGGMVNSPTSLRQAHRSSPRSSVFRYNRVEKEAADRLAAVADPRRCYYQRHDRTPSSSQAAPVRSCPDTSTRVLCPSVSEEHSPPELTSPQRVTRGTHHHSASDAAALEDDDTIAPGRCAKASGDIARLGIRPPAPATATVPFPFSPAPTRERSTGGDRRPSVDSVSRGDHPSGVQDTKLPCQGAQECRATVPVTQSKAVLNQEGRRSMRALIDRAMREACHRSSPVKDASRLPEAHSSQESEAGDEADRRRSRGNGDSCTGNLNSGSEQQLWDYFAGRLSTVPPLHVGCGGDVDCPTPHPRLATSASHTLTRESGGPVPRRQRTDVMVQAQGENVAAGFLHAQMGGLGIHDTTALEPRVLHERQSYREAHEAMLAAQARIAALEMTTNDMAEVLLTHRLSVTFREHLAGMEMLVGRWTRLAQNFCLQKSLLFAEEAAAMVRQLLRVRFGVAPLWSPRAQQQPGRRPTSPFVEVPTSHVQQEEDELWLTREEDEARDSMEDNRSCNKCDGGHLDGPAVAASRWSRSTGEEEEMHHHRGRHTDHPSARLPPERGPLQKSPPHSTPPLLFHFPANLNLRPLSLRL
ncbi:hypothetical protein CUR178_03654 [Leishmania enriettii]|uniref:Uncharacterized protein n=1 Tax=Leishmania enriettii TaxID=5663 RepID=A0A836KH74_LEIEN|nr:hypothetical protein CUR178_03654 [Leishmania enriettii]